MPSTRTNESSRSEHFNWLELDTNDFLFLLKRHWGLVLLPVVFAVAAYFLARLLTPMYEAESILYVRPNFDREMRLDQFSPKLEDSDSLVSVAKSITSPEVVLRSLKTIGVADDPSYYRKPEKKLAKFAEAEKFSAVAKRFNARLIPNTRLIKLSCRDVDPKRAVEINRVIIDQYLNVLIEDREDKEEIMRKSLEGQSHLAKQRALEAEAALTEFREGNLDVLVEQDSQLFQMKVLQVDEALNESKLQSAKLDSMIEGLNSLDELQNPSDFVELIKGSGNEYLTRLLSMRAEAQASLAQAASTYTTKHTLYKQAAKRLSDIDENLQKESQRLGASLAARKKAAESETRRLQDELEQLRKQFVKFKQSSAEFRSLQTLGERHWNTYNEIEQRMMTLDLDPNSLPSFISVVSSPMLPGKPAFPSKRIFFAGGGFIGLVLASLIVLLACFRGLPITSSDQLSRFLPGRKAINLRLPSSTDASDITNGLLQSELFEDLVYDHNYPKLTYLSSFDDSELGQSIPLAWATLLSENESGRVLLVQIGRQPGRSPKTTSLTDQLALVEIFRGDLVSAKGQSLIREKLSKGKFQKVIFDGTRLTTAKCIIDPWLHDNAPSHAHLVFGVRNGLKRQFVREALKGVSDSVIGVLIDGKLKVKPSQASRERESPQESEQAAGREETFTVFASHAAQD